MSIKSKHPTNKVHKHYNKTTTQTNYHKQPTLSQLNQSASQKHKNKQTKITQPNNNQIQNPQAKLNKQINIK